MGRTAGGMTERRGLGKRTVSKAKGRARPLPREWVCIQSRSSGTRSLGTKANR